MAENELNRHELVVIGGSAGSLEVLLELLPAIKSTVQFAIIIVIHRKNPDSILVELLKEKTDLLVKEAEEKDEIKAGTIYIAPADYHLLVEMDKTISMDFSEKVHYSRPCIDLTFETAAEVYGSSLAGILLSGANADGAAGLRSIKEHKGLTIVQDPMEASVPYMPKQAIEEFEVDHIYTTEQMIRLINTLR